MECARKYGLLGVTSLASMVEYSKTTAVTSLLLLNVGEGIWDFELQEDGRKSLGISQIVG